jgi:hypothetical protein
MSPRELLVQLREKGVEIKSNGDRLLIDAPKGAITPDLRDALAANKAELLRILNTPAPGDKLSPRSIEKPVAPKPVEQPPAQRVVPPPSRIVAPAGAGTNCSCPSSRAGRTA